LRYFVPGTLGWEPRGGPHGNCYLRRDDWEKEVSGLPGVPKDWESLILKQPLRGRVVEVLGGGRARVDFGAEGGAWKGMTLWVDAKDSCFLRVVEVGAKSCTVESMCSGSPRAGFQRGQRVGSKLWDGG
jgi:hypothetical protein